MRLASAVLVLGTLWACTQGSTATQETCGGRTCGANTRCVQGQCRATCLTDDDCLNGAVCREALCEIPLPGSSSGGGTSSSRANSSSMPVASSTAGVSSSRATVSSSSAVVSSSSRGSSSAAVPASSSSRASSSSAVVSSSSVGVSSSSRASSSSVGLSSSSLMVVSSSSAAAPDAGIPNGGWIGGPCQTSADCPYDGGICLTQAQGFLEGTCSQDCTRFCPDFNLDGGYSITFCVDPPAGATAAAGLCVSRCNSVAYGDAGCRMGYACVDSPRYMEPTVVRGACVP